MSTNWVDIFIHIPTSSMVTTGPGISDFNETILPQIKDTQNKIAKNYEQSCTNQDMNLNESAITLPNSTIKKDVMGTDNTECSKSKEKI